MKLISTFDDTDSGVKPLSGNDILHVHDVFEAQQLEAMFDQRGRPAIVVSDHLTTCPDLSVKFVGLPLYFYKHICYGFALDNLPDTFSTDYCFNFIVNKKQVSRYLLIKLAEIFNLSNYQYTWSGVDTNFDLSIVINEMDWLGNACPLTPQQRAQLLHPIKLAPRWIEDSVPQVATNAFISARPAIYSWPLGINSVFQNTAVSLITETVSYSRNSVFTEKTGFAILGLTFPLWVGGYNQASEFRRIGFDTFDDVIDHSYESYNTLIERCYYALAKNYNILTNLELATSLRKRYAERLLKNRSRLFDNTVGNFIDAEIAKESLEVQPHLHQVVDFFKSLIL
jgi:hypothetical protein